MNDNILVQEIIDIELLLEHPENYQKHPEDQLEHICKSIEENGLYRNIVISNDNYILAGHGVVQALRKMNYKLVPIVRVNLAHDDIRARKIMIGDNEISHMADVDNRQLVNLLKKINLDNDVDLLGTGFDKMMLANLAFVSFPENEINDKEMAKEWVDLPIYNAYKDSEYTQLIVHFATEEDFNKFMSILQIDIYKTTKYIWYPIRKRQDIKSIKFE